MSHFPPEAPAQTPPRARPDWYYFLDFDGTLVDLAPTPDSVVVPQALIDLLHRLDQATAGKVTVVTGRPLAQVDRFLAPLTLPTAAQHGGERRYPDGRTAPCPPPNSALVFAAEHLQTVCVAYPGALLERKPASLALHFREAPEAERPARAAMEVALTLVGSGYRVLEGKKVLELKRSDIDKGSAVDAFLNETGYSALPVAIGDDRTDEDTFALVNKRGGISIRVGGAGEPTQARYLLADPKAVHAWLAHACDPNP